jgi:transposase
MSMVSGVFGGVDTHADVHVAAAIDRNGGVLGIKSFPTDAAGYRSLLFWLSGFGPVVRVGVEGTGSYGVGLARYLYNEGIEVVEVDRPDRQARRRLGKSDPVDAEAAARAALSTNGNPDRRQGSCWERPTRSRWGIDSRSAKTNTPCRCECSLMPALVRTCAPQSSRTGP